MTNQIGREGFQMNCAQANEWLDCLMDGELTDDERRRLEAHAATCPACDEQLRATLTMKALFDDMPAEADVPLAAQAKWRDAVRAEAKRDKTRRLTRWIGTAAAALLLVAGIGWGLNARDIPRTIETRQAATDSARAYEAADTGADAIIGDAEAPVMNAAAPEMLYEAEAADYAETAVIEADGAVEAALEAKTGGAPMREIHMKVADIDAACGVIADLVAEYDGTADAQRTEGGANLYITLPTENAAEFLSAIAHLETSGEAPEIPDDLVEGTSSLLLVLEN